MGRDEKDCFIALDNGSASCGYCMIGSDYKPVKIRGKNAIGVRLFDEAQTAAARRLARSARRRLNKKKMRLSVLRDIFYPHITAFDETFFARLDESFLFYEDKTVKCGNILFDDPGFTDKDYYRAYPTIFHLRKHLAASGEKADLRLVYLALHNIMKKRGHFLSETLDPGASPDRPAEGLRALRERLLRLTGDEAIEIGEETAAKIIEILSASTRSGREKLAESAVAADGCKLPVVKQLYKFLLGLKADFPAAASKENPSVKLTASDDDFEEKSARVAELLGDADFLPAAKLFYDGLQLKKLGLRPGMTVSDLQVKRFETHRAQLAELKAAVKALCPEKYKAFFHAYPPKDTHNYAKYVMGRSLTSHADLVKAVEKLLRPYAGDPRADRVLDALGGEEYLPLPRSSRNAVLGYELSAEEARRILDRQGKFYPFLAERAGDIITLLSFRVDYFVGPLYEPDEKNKFSFLVKKSAERITPFNYDDVVDFEKTEDNFITRMTGRCTYLPDEDVLPRNSLLYSEFSALNLINNIRVGGERLSADQREALVKRLKGVAGMGIASIKNWWTRQFAEPCPEITGLADDAKLSMKPFRDFAVILGRDVLPGTEEYDHVEEIIRWQTVFSDRKTRRARIETKRQALNLSDAQIERLSALRYEGWGRLSRKLLAELTIPVRGAPYRLLDIMARLGRNFMQALTYEGDGGVTILRGVEAENSDRGEDGIDRLFLSPQVKRGLRQSVRIVDELIKLSGRRPKAIMLEFAAEDGEKKATVSRLDRVTRLFAEAKKSEPDSGFFCGEAVSVGGGEALRDEELLYLTQQCKCMYCGRRLTLDRLAEEAQTDHIIPRSLIKDDSLDNKALVCTRCNQDKRDGPVPPQVRRKQADFWEYLLRHGFISARKFARLNAPDFGEAQIKGFINRQLVETRQTIRAAAEILSARYKIPVIPIRLDAVKALRELLGYVKNDGIRRVNDFHHAFDAYLAGVLGAFGWQSEELNPIIDPQADPALKKEYLGKIVRQIKAGKGGGRYGIVVDKMTGLCADRDGRVVWLPERDLPTVKKVLRFRDVTVSRLTLRESGAFYNATKNPGLRKATLLGKNKLDYAKHVPIKGTLDPVKYGGYTSVNPAFGALIEYTKGKKGGRVRDIFSVSRLLASKLGLLSGNLKEKLAAYLKEEKGEAYPDARVLRIVPKYQLVEIDGIRYRISGDYLHNAGQLRLPAEQLDVVGRLFDKNGAVSDEETEELMRVYLGLLERYYPRYGSFAAKLKTYLDTGGFAALTAEEKKRFVGLCLDVTKPGSAQVKMKVFSTDRVDFSVSEGIMTYAKKDVSKMIFIDQSVTGLVEKREL